MPRRIILYPYKMGSESCRELARSLNAKTNVKILRVRPNGRYRPRTNDAIINWGNSHEPGWRYTDIINRPRAVSVAANKLLTLEALRNIGASHVPFTRERSVAVEWPMVVERHTLTGHSGAGIIINPNTAFSNAPLYTKLLTPSHEYRVHVFKGTVIDYTKKMKRTEDGLVSRMEDEYVKNRAGGWEYLRDVEPRESVKELAIAAVEALGLDFGAVDIIRHKRKNYVLEVGTAPGLSPRGLEAYSDAIIDLVTN